MQEEVDFAQILRRKFLSVTTTSLVYFPLILNTQNLHDHHADTRICLGTPSHILCVANK